MPLIVSFIGRHNSGKTTMIRRVVAQLKKRGRKVAVIKSTKETNIYPDTPGTDTFELRAAGANAVALAAPDQLVASVNARQKGLKALAGFFFADMDIVIGEGFKHERDVPKIEVTRTTAPLLRDEVQGVIAMVTDLRIDSLLPVFGTEQGEQLADFIDCKAIQKRDRDREKKSDPDV